MIIKRKLYALLNDGTGKSISSFKAEFNKLGGKDKLGSFKDWYRGKAPNTMNVGGSAISQGASGSAIGKSNSALNLASKGRSAVRAKNIANPKLAIKNAGYKRGYLNATKTVGLKQGAMNTWGRMGKAGKAGTIAAAAGGAYLLGKGLFGGSKNK